MMFNFFILLKRAKSKNKIYYFIEIVIYSFFSIRSVLYRSVHFIDIKSRIVRVKRLFSAYFNYYSLIEI